MEAVCLVCTFAQDSSSVPMCRVIGTLEHMRVLNVVRKASVLEWVNSKKKPSMDHNKPMDFSTETILVSDLLILFGQLMVYMKPDMHG